MKLGPKLSETVKGKLRLGAKIVQGGGRESIFKQVFGMEEGEEFLKASQCYLSTTAGPIAGLLFISTKKIAFCSERSITFPSPNGKLVRSPYKVLQRQQIKQKFSLFRGLKKLLMEKWVALMYREYLSVCNLWGCSTEVKNKAPKPTLKNIKYEMNQRMTCTIVVIFAGSDTDGEDKASEPEREREQSSAEVHRNTHRRRLRVLVHGVLEVREGLQES